MTHDIYHSKTGSSVAMVPYKGIYRIWFLWPLFWWCLFGIYIFYCSSVNHFVKDNDINAHIIYLSSYKGIQCKYMNKVFSINTYALRQFCDFRTYSAKESSGAWF